MSVHKYNSWGRTRQPKNLAGAHETEVTVSTSNPSAATDGHRTENQRYLHLFLNTDPSGDNRTITVFGYYYAFGVWVALKDTAGNDVEIAAHNTTAHKIFEIAGVDRVYFKANGAFNSLDVMMAAGSTFQGS